MILFTDENTRTSCGVIFLILIHVHSVRRILLDFSQYIYNAICSFAVLKNPQCSARSRFFYLSFFDALIAAAFISNRLERVKCSTPSFVPRQTCTIPKDKSQKKNVSETTEMKKKG